MKVELGGVVPRAELRWYVELPEGVLSLQGSLGPTDSRGAVYETVSMGEGFATEDEGKKSIKEIAARFQSDIHMRLAGAAAIEWRTTPYCVVERVMHLTRERPWRASIRARFSVHPDLLFTPVQVADQEAA